MRVLKSGYKAYLTTVEGYTDTLETTLAAFGGVATAGATGAVTDTDLLMAYIKQLVTAILLIPTTAMRGTDSAALAAVLGALNTAAATGAVSDAKAGMAYLKQLVTQNVSCMIFPSAPDDIIVIDSTASDIDFPSVVVAGLPTGATILRVDVFVSIGAIFDTSAAENQIKTGTTDELRVKLAAGAWGTDDVQALVFPALGLQVDADAYRGGTVLFGGVDVKSEVTGNGTYNFRSEETEASKGVESTGDSLELLDVQTFIRIWFN